MATTDPLHLRCVGTTGDAFYNSIAESHESKTGHNQERTVPNHFCDAQFSGDGTAIITQNSDRCLRSFVLPPDLLENSAQPHLLGTHSVLQSPTPILSYACYPHFNLQDPSTTVVLSAAPDLPITLTNALHFDTVHAKYSLINPTTEEYIAPSSLIWTRDGTHFVGGSRHRISVFDPSYDGSGPVLTHKTAPGRRQKKTYGAESVRGCQGLVNALSINSDGILAAGTRERCVALYSREGSGELVTDFSVSAERVKGSGITQLAWSPCGTYLLVAERQSDGIQVYDMRSTLTRVAWLSGRKADTTQRLSLDVVSSHAGYEVWAGGTDGCVRMWKNPGAVEGEQRPNAVLEAHNGKRDFHI